MDQAAMIHKLTLLLARPSCDHPFNQAKVFHNIRVLSENLLHLTEMVELLYLTNRLPKEVVYDRNRMREIVTMHLNSCAAKPTMTADEVMEKIVDSFQQVREYL